MNPEKNQDKKVARQNRVSRFTALLCAIPVMALF